MKRTVLFFATSAVILCLSGMPAFAQRGGGGRGGGGMGGMGGGTGTRGGMGGQRDPMGTRSQKQKKAQTEDRVAAELRKNTALAKKLEALLPDGADARNAGRGFKSVGDLMAAAHASKNLNIPFSDLRRQMAGQKKLSLDKAIVQIQKDTKPDAAKAAAKTAKEQGDKDIKDAKNEMKAAKG